MQRYAEFGGKARVIAEEAFGEKLKDMYSIEILATDPAAQGRGYGAALMQYIISKVRNEDI